MNAHLVVFTQMPNGSLRYVFVDEETWKHFDLSNVELELDIVEELREEITPLVIGDDTLDFDSFKEAVAAIAKHGLVVHDEELFCN